VILHTKYTKRHRIGLNVHVLGGAEGRPGSAPAARRWQVLDVAGRPTHEHAQSENGRAVSWPRSWSNFSLFQLYPLRDAWADQLAPAFWAELTPSSRKLLENVLLECELYLGLGLLFPDATVFNL
jgi:hypothetical protein